MTPEPPDPPDEPSSLPVLLEAVLNVGSELELRTTLQHIVESAAELCAARYGALGVVDPERAPRAPRVAAG
ncbi:histidine kinase, partial [Streptomyces lavendulae]